MTTFYEDKLLSELDRIRFALEVLAGVEDVHERLSRANAREDAWQSRVVGAEVERLTNELERLRIPPGAGRPACAAVLDAEGVTYTQRHLARAVARRQHRSSSEVS